MGSRGGTTRVKEEKKESFYFFLVWELKRTVTILRTRGAHKNPSKTTQSRTAHVHYFDKKKKKKKGCFALCVVKKQQQFLSKKKKKATTVKKSRKHTWLLDWNTPRSSLFICRGTFEYQLGIWFINAANEVGLVGKVRIFCLKSLDSSLAINGLFLVCNLLIQCKLSLRPTVCPFYM